MSTNEKQRQIVTYRRIEPSDELDSEPRADVVAVEEPMEIRVVSGPVERRKGKSISITMRTPGSDPELAIGFLFAEGIVRSRAQVASVEHCGPTADAHEEANTVRVELVPGVEFDAKRYQRHFYATSSCGVCGKASLDALEYDNLKPVESEIQISPELVMQLPERLMEQQTVFANTGGIHAAGLFDHAGVLVAVREDVGRHNAMDKLIGHQLLAGQVPLSDQIVVVSGRASFELLQKALAAGIPIFIAVGAPSSLAVELAEQYSITLIGFASKSRFNVYCGHERILGA